MSQDLYTWTEPDLTSLDFIDKSLIFNNQLVSIRCEHDFRWQRFFLMKKVLFFLDKTIFELWETLKASLWDQ